MTKKVIGQVGVDSGSILISDPSYINDAFSIQGDDIYDIYPENKRYKQISTRATRNTIKIPIAMTLRTGYGDGVYPVVATYNRDGVISRIEIDFE